MVEENNPLKLISVKGASQSGVERTGSILIDSYDDEHADRD